MEDVTILAITRENDETNIVLNSDLVLVFDSLKTTFEIMIEGEIINRNTLIEILYATINEIRISTPIKN
ncbi:hypothetical protein [[Clostridium] innocuum]|uniref:hypothetical protein n=2 Tax=Bacteria TaxID=2 RepID=UPI001AFB7799|nr:hypothetical protein [[Clostridium] innocuum]MDU1018798.1 hypothetical protein [Bifidobacterium breve]QSI26894.1 hypothetical protein GKZ87_16070 [Erysipelotrichaceae bacterium 66202529]MCC2831861.1 hypothetical protein [[Clostridium] innocuum]MCR0248577.1 hypothetical protein [[Clostridium] innocuum]MCR0261088.1 hypothetical protein [[Clostridium] innocuum]